MKNEAEVRTLGAGKFKATCLQLMDEVAEKNLTVIITKRGKAVAQLGAPTAEAAKTTKPTKTPKPAKLPKTPKPEKTPKPAKAKAVEPGAGETVAVSAAGEEKHGKKKDKGKKKKHK